MNPASAARPAAPQPDSAARPGRRQHDDLEPGLLAALLREPAVQRRARRGLDAEFLHRDLVQPLRGERRGDRLGAGALQRGQLRRQLLRQHRLRAHLAVRPRLAERVVRRPDRGRADDAADRRLPVAVRHVGSLRLRRRRELQRAGRLHRPFPVDPRRRGRGDGRRRGGRERHLEPSLVHVLHQHRRHRSDLQPCRRPPGRRQQLLGRRLHDRAGERRRRRVLARVRPRPRPARSVRTRSAATTPPASGPSCRPARTATTARSTSARSPRTWAPGRSSSSGG